MENIHREVSFPAPPSEVFDVIKDPQFHTEMLAEAGALDGSNSTVTADGDSVTIATTRVLSSDMIPDRVPDMVRSMLGKSLTISEVQQWQPAAADGSRRGTLTAELKGAPVKVAGATQLQPDGDGTKQIIDADLTVDVFLIGPQVEKMAAPMLGKVLEAAIEAVRSRLST